VKQFYAVRGLSGSGKSTLAKSIAAGKDDAFIFSTDNYFIRPDGFYDFNFRRLHEAHAWNFKNCSEALDLGLSYVILDNVNSNLWEFEKYVEYAHKCGYEIFICDTTTPWAKDATACFNKNVHGVPLETLQKKLDKWESTQSIVNILKKKGIVVNVR
jgi:predicted kinase